MDRLAVLNQLRRLVVNETLAEACERPLMERLTIPAETCEELIRLNQRLYSHCTGVTHDLRAERQSELERLLTSEESQA